MIYLTGIVVTFFLVVLMTGEKRKGAPHHILTAWLFCIGVHSTAYYAYASGAFRSFPYYLGFEIPLPYLHGPFLYWYTSALTNPPSSRPRAWPHFLPFLACYVLLLPFLMLPASSRLYIFEHNGQGYEAISAVIRIGIILSGLAYVALSLLQLRRYKKFILDRFSDTDRINLAWLRYLIYSIGLIWAAVILGNDAVIYSLTTLFVLFIGYFGIKQVGILARTPVYPAEPDAQAAATADTETPAPPEDPAVPGESAKYEKSRLRDEQIADLHQALTRLVVDGKLYRDSGLALTDLAAKLGIHANYLSQVINSVERKNFYDYINDLRVAEFKRLVSNPENQRFTLLGLAFECGFSSKTAFNRNFKKATGLTPSAYLDRLDIHLESTREE